MNGQAQAQRHYDRQEPVEIISEEWTAQPKQILTHEQIEEFIFEMADSGCYGDELGRAITAPSIYLALAMEYRHDKAAIPSAISSAFFDWAKSAAYVAAYGKPYLLQEQAGLRITRTNND